MNEKTDERLGSIDRYEIIRELGQGGTSVVYLAADRTDGRTFAMKVLRRVRGSEQETLLKAAGQRREDASEHLRREAEVLKALCSIERESAAGCRSIPMYRECVCDEKGDFAGFVMEYVEGRSLRQILEEGRKYSVREAAEAGVQLCAVLERLHGMDPPIIYRDLKPANILVRPDGTWVVVDFGAVRKYKKGAGRDTDRIGTEGYAAPEQYGGWEQSDARTDIYGIGAVLHHMITGRSPLETGLRPPEELRTSTGAERLPRYYAYMVKILLRCCSVAPSMRYSSCAELEKAVKSIAGQLDDGGLFVASIRDYDRLLEVKPPCSAPYVYKTPKGQRVLFQTWDWVGENYRFIQYVIRDEDSVQVSRFESEYRATKREEITELLRKYGCASVVWRMPEQTGFYQPVVLARK